MKKFFGSFCFLAVFIVGAFLLVSDTKEIQASTYSDQVESETNLLYYWKMNETAGATTSAPTVGGIYLKLNNATSGVSGQDGTAVSFSSTTSSYAVSSTTLMLAPYTKVVVEALVNFTPSYDGQTRTTWELSADTNATTSGLFAGVLDRDQYLVFVKGDGGTANNGIYPNATANTWHHVVAVYDKALSNEIEYYVDGQKLTANRTLLFNNTNNFGNHLFYLMSRGGSSLFNSGRVQHLAIYSNLSESDITDHCEASGLNCVTQYDVTPSDVDDNRYNNSGTPRYSTFSRFSFLTNASTTQIVGISPAYASFPQYAHLGYRLNGVDQSPLVFTTSTIPQTFTLNLGAAGVEKEIEIIMGLQSKPSTVLGSYINSVVYPSTASFSLSAEPNPENRMLIYGDSIAVGANATYPTSQSYVQLLRNTYNKKIILEAWGYRALNNDAPTEGDAQSFAGSLTDTDPASIYLAVGTNDYGFNLWNATDFGESYGYLLDAIHTELPDIKVFCQTPILRSSEVANGLGSTLGDYRTAIINECSSRDWTYIVNGPDLLALSDLDDGVHPTTAGFAKYADHINHLFVITPTVTTDPATNITRTTATFNGTITGIGSTTPTTRGFVYGKTTEYEIGTTTASGQFTTGSFSADVTDLECGQTYYVKAYAINFAGIAYGNDFTITTNSACGSSGSGGGGGSSGGRRHGTYVDTTTPVISPVVPVVPTIPTLPTIPVGGSTGLFNKNLSKGMTDPDVKRLQQYLNTHGYVIAQSGPGSPGNETDFFGLLTYAAVIRLQEVNAAVILTPNGLTKGTGLFGPSTRKFVNGN